MAQLAFNIERETVANLFYRKVIWTGTHQQLVLMSLKPGETIDMEMHEAVDQFFRVEKGEMTVMPKGATPVRVPADHVVYVRAGTWHEVVAGAEGAKLYTIYAPPNHPVDHIDRDKPPPHQH